MKTNHRTFAARKFFGVSGLVLMVSVLSSPTIAQTWSTDSNNSNNIYYNSGNVGIGVSSPKHKLDINGNINFADTGGIGWGGLTMTDYVYGTAAAHYIAFVTNSSEGIRLDANGKVGIGTTSPGAQLHLSSASGGSTFFLDGTATGNPYISFRQNNVEKGYMQYTDNGASTDYLAFSAPSFYFVTGNVGIGTTTPPETRLAVNGQGRFDSGASFSAIDTGWAGAYGYSGGNWGVRLGATSAQGVIQAAQGTTAYDLAIQPYGGAVGIGTSPASGYNLDVNGDSHVTGDITLTGTIRAKYQDVAEWVPSSEQLAAGTVVVLDSTKSNQVISSSVSYDTRVAGVISAQPGIALGEKSDSKVLVATTGRVKVKVDASKSPIRIGDLLVTSDVPGVAMKSEAVNLGGVQFHRPGTLIGKALEPWEKGKGEILVLLSLQ
jgi:hypothetical protein